MRKPLIAGNWKMNLIPEEAGFILDKLMTVKEKEVELLICPSFIALPLASEKLKNSFIKLCAQNMYPEIKGAFTGEISPNMLKALRCEYVICGHSERRTLLGESNDFIRRKVSCALSHNIIPILCVGESQKDRTEGMTEECIRKQIFTALSDLKRKELSRIVVAYEPIWAIGTGISATATDAEKVAKFIRNELTCAFGKQVAEEIRILYGGSVNITNITDFMHCPNIDGALIGGASLKPTEFIEIYNKI